MEDLTCRHLLFLWRCFHTAGPRSVRRQWRDQRKDRKGSPLLIQRSLSICLSRSLHVSALNLFPRPAASQRSWKRHHQPLGRDSLREWKGPWWRDRASLFVRSPIDECCPTGSTSINQRKIKSKRFRGGSRTTSDSYLHLGYASIVDGKFQDTSSTLKHRRG